MESGNRTAERNSRCTTRIQQLHKDRKPKHSNKRQLSQILCRKRNKIHPHHRPQNRTKRQTLTAERIGRCQNCNHSRRSCNRIHGNGNGKSRSVYRQAPRISSNLHLLRHRRQNKNQGNQRLTRPNRDTKIDQCSFNNCNTTFNTPSPKTNNNLRSSYVNFYSIRHTQTS